MLASRASLVDRPDRRRTRHFNGLPVRRRGMFLRDSWQDTLVRYAEGVRHQQMLIIQEVKRQASTS